MIRRSRDERGTILPMMVGLVVITVALAAFAVDLGVQRVARSDLQALTDVVAQDLARGIKGRTKAQIQAPGSDWQTLTQRSVARNAHTVGSDPEVDSELGKLDSTGEWADIGGTAVPTAVRVTARTTVSHTFVSGSGSTSRSAIATVDPTVCFSVSSFAAALNTSDSALNNLLGDIAGIDLKAGGSPGIVTLKGLTVPLADLAVKLGAGTPEQLLATQTTVGQFLLAAAEVLSGTGTTAGVTLLQRIRTGLNVLGGSRQQQLTVGQILQVATGEGSALGAKVNALDLVTAALFAAGKGHALAVRGLNLNLGVAGAAANLTILNPPTIACGRVGAFARSAQVEVDLSAKLLGGLAGLTVDLEVGVAAATGTLTAITCRRSGSDSISVRPVTSVLDKLLLQIYATVLFLPVKVAQVELRHVLTGTTVDPRVLTYPPMPSTDLPTASVTPSSSALGLSGMYINVLGVLPLPIGSLLGTLDPLLSAILQPVLGLVGLSLGGADVAAVSRPNCDAPRLQG